MSDQKTPSGTFAEQGGRVLGQCRVCGEWVDCGPEWVTFPSIALNTHEKHCAGV